MYGFASRSLSEVPVDIDGYTTKVDKCLILQYHRVALLCHDPFQLVVEPYHFEEQMEYLAETFNVISIDEMKEHLEKGAPFRDKTVIVTFDGGFSDVLYTAKDVLERYKIPAVVFTASANITEGGQFWWQELEDLLIANEADGYLELMIEGRFHKWPARTHFEKFRAYEDLYSILSKKTPSEQKEIIEAIAQSRELRAAELDNHRTMDADELKSLDESGLITIGGHTHNYVNLSALPKWQQNEEVLKNKNVLEEVLGHSIEYFSYPLGSGDKCTSEINCILENSGFSLACGNSYGMVNVAEGTNRYELPRVKVGNWNPFAYYRFLRRFFN